MSSTYFVHSRGLYSNGTVTIAICSMYISATIGETGLPIAVPNLSCGIYLTSEDEIGCVKDEVFNRFNAVWA